MLSIWPTGRKIIHIAEMLRISSYLGVQPYLFVAIVVETWETSILVTYCTYRNFGLPKNLLTFPSNGLGQLTCLVHVQCLVCGRQKNHYYFQLLEQSEVYWAWKAAGKSKFTSQRSVWHKFSRLLHSSSTSTTSTPCFMYSSSSKVLLVVPLLLPFLFLVGYAKCQCHHLSSH